MGKKVNALMKCEFVYGRFQRVREKRLRGDKRGREGKGERNSLERTPLTKNLKAEMEGDM
jgi:hypothetical protein